MKNVNKKDGKFLFALHVPSIFYDFFHDFEGIADAIRSHSPEGKWSGY